MSGKVIQKLKVDVRVHELHASLITQEFCIWKVVRVEVTDLKYNELETACFGQPHF